MSAPKERAPWLTCSRCSLSAPDVRGEPPLCPDASRCETVKKSGVQGFWWPPDFKAHTFPVGFSDAWHGEGSFHL